MRLMPTITIPNWHPASANRWSGSHWAVRSRVKRADREMVAHYARSSQAPTATGKRRVRLKIVLGPRQRGCDPDNYWKSLLDALKHAGMIVDDSRNWVETPPVEFTRGTQRATIIELTDIEGEP